MRPARRATRDRARGQRLFRGRRTGRPGTDRTRARPVGNPHPARRGQDPDARWGGDRRVRQARHHDGGVPVRGPVRAAPGRTAGRWLPTGHTGTGGLPGDLAGRTARGVHRGHPGRDGPRPQAVEAHAVSGRSRARGQRHPFPPVSPRPFPRAPPGAAAGPPRAAHRRRICARGREQQAGDGREARGREQQAGGGREARGREQQAGGGREARGREEQSAGAGQAERGRAQAGDGREARGRDKQSAGAGTTEREAGP